MIGKLMVICEKSKVKKIICEKSCRTLAIFEKSFSIVLLI